MKLSNKTYDVLKWVVMILIPALVTFYVALAGVLHLPFADEIAKIAAAICTLIGSLLGISTAEYRKIERWEGMDND